MDDLLTIRKAVDKRLAAFDHARRQYRQESQSLAAVQERAAALAEAQGIAQAAAQLVQQRAHKQIATIVTRFLSIFDDPYEFRILFDRKRGRTEARLLFERDGKEVDPMSASGGGVVDVAAFALRVSCLLLSRPPLSRVLVFDEPFKFVSEEYHPALRQMIQGLSKDLDVQFIMVTHIEGLQIGKVVKLPCH